MLYTMWNSFMWSNTNRCIQANLLPGDQLKWWESIRQNPCSKTMRGALREGRSSKKELAASKSSSPCNQLCLPSLPCSQLQVLLLTWLGPCQTSAPASSTHWVCRREVIKKEKLSPELASASATVSTGVGPVLGAGQMGPGRRRRRSKPSPLKPQPLLACLWCWCHSTSRRAQPRPL